MRYKIYYKNTIITVSSTGLIMSIVNLPSSDNEFIEIPFIINKLFTDVIDI